MGISGVGGSHPYYGYSGGDGPLGHNQQMELDQLRNCLKNMENRESAGLSSFTYWGEDYAVFHAQLVRVASDLKMPDKYRNAAYDTLNALEADAQWGPDNKVTIDRSCMLPIKAQYE
jgi:hypothetical protein